MFVVHCGGWTTPEKMHETDGRAKALEVCLALERAEGMAAHGTLTEARARELIGEVLERTYGDTLPFYTAKAWLRDWLREKQISKSEGTHVKYSRTIESFINHLGSRSKINVSAISPKDIATFRDAEIANGKNPNTVRYLIKHLRIPFNAARRRGLLIHNPAESVARRRQNGWRGGNFTGSVQPSTDQSVAGRSRSQRTW